MDAVVRVCGAASMIHDTETNLLAVLFPILPFLALSAVNLVSRPCFRLLTACLHTPFRTSQVTGREAGNARKRLLGALNNSSLAKPIPLIENRSQVNSGQALSPPDASVRGRGKKSAVLSAAYCSLKNTPGSELGRFLAL